ncbi:MAG: MFS transporter [Alphaproteobacteria bacterium]|nr:MFS transporter [Alphaproteobacteria bacterium]
MIASTTSLPAPFVRLARANLAAQTAEQIALAAIPMVAVLALGAGTGETGFLAAMQSLPFLLLALPAGILADRLPRARLMAAAEALRVLALLLLPAAALLALLSVPLLAAVGFLAASGTVVFTVAAPTLVPALVPRDEMAAANGRLELARSLAFAGGPALAGALVAWAGASLAFVLALGLSASAALLLATIPEPARPASAPRPILHELKEGAGFAWGHALIRPILLTAVAWNVSWFVLQAAYVPYAVHVLGLGGPRVGVTLGLYGAGMVAGAALAPRIARVVSFGLLIALGPLVSVLAAVVMAASLWLPNAALPGAAFFLFGFGPILWTIGQTTLRQAVTPPAMLGRVSGLVTIATAGARPIGAAVGGIAGAAYGPSTCLVLAAIGFVVQALVIMASPVPRLARLPEPVAA